MKARERVDSQDLKLYTFCTLFLGSYIIFDFSLSHRPNWVASSRNQPFCQYMDLCFGVFFSWLVRGGIAYQVVAEN